MNKRIRLTILLFCAVCFLAISPILVAYSMGYRFDFEKNKIVATGGIYVRTFPSAGQVTIDSKITEKPGLFNNSIFVQSLLPKEHTVYIKKDGYFDYLKTLPVQENQVTKLENVLLIKKNLKFSDFADKIDYFSVALNNQNVITATADKKNIVFKYFSANTTQQKTFSITQINSTEKISNIKWSEDSSKALIKTQTSNNNFYYIFDNSLQKPSAVRLSFLDKNSEQISFNPQSSNQLFFLKNNILYYSVPAQNSSINIAIKNVIAYKISNSNIVWLSEDGLLYKSNLSGKLIEKLSAKDILIDPNESYEIIIASGKTFIKEKDALFLFNPSLKLFENYNTPISDYKLLFSPDGKNLIYFNKNNIYISSFLEPENEKVSLYQSSGNITDCFWLNNDYLIFSSGEKIIISEIDYRGNINSVILPGTLTLNDNKIINVKNPKIFFDQLNEKLYVMTESTLILSEKLTP